MYEAILLFWLLFAIYLTFHYPCVLLLKGIYYKNTFKSNRNSITKYFFGHFVWYFHWLCDFYYNMRSVRFDANCAKSHQRTTSEGLCDSTVSNIFFIKDTTGVQTVPPLLSHELYDYQHQEALNSANWSTIFSFFPASKSFFNNAAISLIFLVGFAPCGPILT